MGIGHCSQLANFSQQISDLLKQEQIIFGNRLNTALAV